MNFLVDAQLPRRPTRRLQDAGHDAVHTLDLPNKNRTADVEICETSDRQRRVVITKDADFVNSFIASGQPHKLLLISTGNITNAELESIFVRQMKAIADAFESSQYIELTRLAIIIHA